LIDKQLLFVRNKRGAAESNLIARFRT
jgi:hypothetical protein